MRHTLQQLLDENPFVNLGIAPSTDAAELRRALEQARLEVSMGMRALSEVDLAAAGRTFTHEPDCFEMRMFLSWRGDPLLEPWAAEHDAALRAIRRLRTGSPTEIDEILRTWLTLYRAPDLVEVVALQVAPPGTDLGAFWGEVAGELVHFATLRESELSGIELLDQVIQADAIDPGPVAAALVETFLVSVDGRAAALPSDYLSSDPAQRDSSIRTLTNAAGLFVEFVARAGELQLRLSAAMAPRPGGTVRPGASDFARHTERLSEKLRALSYTYTNPLFGAQLFSEAEAVDEAVLRLALSADSREQLLADFAAIRNARAHADLDAAMDRNDPVGAVSALEQLVRYALTAADRSKASELLVKIRTSGLRTPALDALRPISKAPSLSDTPGLGRTLYRQRDYDAGSMSWVMTRYLTILYLPLFPLGRYRVRHFGARGYAFLGKLPLLRFDIVHRWAATALLIAGLIAGGVAYSRTGSGSRQHDASASSGSTRRLAAPPDLRVGDCVTSDVSSSIRVPCGVKNAGRVSFVGALSGSNFPTDAELAAQADAICPASANKYIAPTFAGWNAGSRTLACVIAP